MGIHVIRMPDIGEGIAEVELVAWHVQPGDAVVEDQVLADVMTDKATVEIPSPVSGRVQWLGGEVGQTMAVGSELIRIELDATAGAAAPAPGAVAAAAPGAVAAPVPAAVAAAAAAPTEAASAGAARATGAPAAAAATPVAAARAAPAAMRAAPAPAAVAPAAAAPAPAAVAGHRPLASPSVRARAWELGIELASVVGSGPGGRIVHADLDAVGARADPARRSAAGQRPAAAASARPAAGRPTAPGPAPAAPAAGAAATMLTAAATDAIQTEKIIGLRRKIAQRMQDAKRRIPHFGYVDEVDAAALEALRAQLNARYGAARGQLNPLPFVVRAIVLAAPEFPEINARFDDEAGELTRYAAVHVGVATQAPAGLLVPVLRQAQTLDLWAIAAGVSRLAELARSGKIARDELSGSTITVTSLGRLAGLSSSPVINAPETAIVAVNRIAPRAVVRDGAVVARPTLLLSAAFDHRIVDGTRAAGFMQRVRELLEQPALLFIG